MTHRATSRGSAPVQDRSHLQPARSQLRATWHTTWSGETELSAHSPFHLVAANDVAHPSKRPDQLLARPVIDFAAEMADVNIHDVVGSIEALVPHMFENHGARKYTSGICHQVFEQTIFLRCKLNALAGTAYLLRKAIQFQVAHSQYAGLRDRPSAQQRLHSHEQFSKCERLG